MGLLAKALIITLGINVMLWLGQVAALELNPESPVYYSCADTLLGSLEASNCEGATYILSDGNVSSQLPTGGGTVQIGSGNIFTDTFGVIASWFASVTGLKYVTEIITAPSNFLKAIGLPPAVSFSLAALWYAFTLLLVVGFFTGRDA